MIKKNKGNIIIVSSGASSIKGAPNRFIYGTTKAALNGFVKALAVDFVKKGIRCNAILPGTVETPSWEGRVAMAEDPVQARKDFIARQAMGRLAQPEEIASLGVYLASDESAFVTGTLNLIDGGWTL
jgi:Dehydrogenases with different specificities (related to short-chain alcohol dehydrogenases)